MSKMQTPLHQEVSAAFTSALEASTLPDAAKEVITADYHQATSEGAINSTLFQARQRVAEKLNKGEYTSVGIPAVTDTEGYRNAGHEIAKAFEASQKILQKHAQEAQAVSFRERRTAEIVGANLQPSRA